MTKKNKVKTMKHKSICTVQYAYVGAEETGVVVNCKPCEESMGFKPLSCVHFLQAAVKAPVPIEGIAVERLSQRFCKARRVELVLKLFTLISQWFFLTNPV